jgi:hypothetical protein
MMPTRGLLFPPTSRYHNVEATTFTTPAGEEIACLKRRFQPAPERFTSFQEHFVVEGDRLDNITALYLNDPLQFWRICDANTAMNPPDLITEIGRRLRIALPDGIPEIPNVAG